MINGNIEKVVMGATLIPASIYTLYQMYPVITMVSTALVLSVGVFVVIHSRSGGMPSLPERGSSKRVDVRIIK